MVRSDRYLLALAPRHLLGTITVGGIQHAVIAPLMATMKNSQEPWQGVSEPTHTVTAGGAGLTLIAASLMSLKGISRRQARRWRHERQRCPTNQIAPACYGSHARAD